MKKSTKHLIEGYSKLGHVKKLDNGELLIEKEKYSHKVILQDIETYDEFFKIKDDYYNKPNECSIINSDYFEQVINPTNLRSSTLLRHSRGYKFGQNSENQVYGEIGKCSDLFFNYFRFNEQKIGAFEGRNFRSQHFQAEKDIRKAHYQPITIKLFNLNATNLENAIVKSEQLTKSALFSLMSLKRLSFTLSSNWSNERTRKFKLKDEEIGTDLPLKNVKLKSDLLSYYQLGITNDIPASSFLAFYQVLEYNFMEVSNDILYKRLSNRINDIKFSTKPRNLNKIIYDVNRHKQKTDETKMLKDVLREFVPENDIIEFIKEYEKFLGEDFYSKRRTIFGNDINGKNIFNGDGHSYHVIATGIKSIRNALVHSGDRYEYKERYVPFSKKNTKIIEMELPLMKFLAEKVIIATCE